MKINYFKIVLLIIAVFFLSSCALEEKQLTPLPDFSPPDFKASQYKSAVDNFYLVLDASSSMGEKFNSNEKFTLATEFINRMNQSLPELGQTCGLRSYGHNRSVSKELTTLFYGIQAYSTGLYSSALNKISAPGGTSPMGRALAAVQTDMAGLDGKTALIIVSDGKDIAGSAESEAAELVEIYGSSLCIYTVLVGDNAGGRELMKSLAHTGECGFASSAGDLLTSSAMAGFVEKVFLSKKEVKKPVVRPAKKDSDKDGVYDDEDQCPDTPFGVNVDSRGCPIDSDGDGVYDYQDKCPGTPRGAHVNNLGCWVLGSPLFDTDRSNIKSEWYSELNHIAAILEKNPSLNIVLEGHTDNVGTKKYNMNLSKKRARAVKTYLVNKGISAARIECEGFGFSRPSASNETENGRAQNRRVEITPVQ
ncbi:MAG: OmpA family protein [Thermodesulfobacteriota bacterium]|nr:OmpA family protein [Thermodesulfobacteriota bacterium]